VRECLIWFDINKEADWRIGSPPESEAAFIRMAKDPYFNPSHARKHGSSRDVAPCAVLSVTWLLSQAKG
jgi:hypothetical protein